MKIWNLRNYQLICELENEKFFLYFIKNNQNLYNNFILKFLSNIN